ncbi:MULTISPECIES: homoserine dehydrogenase [unclassified Solibacillus]|uniref:homoserine dehydrogenase n=1 Tax=unclassified Solibacillus TaxID=2637870 RepID=UPI0030F5DA48
MQKNKYRVHSNTLLEIAQSRAFTEKDNIDERFDEEGKIKLVSDRVGADLTLSIIKTEDGIAYSVKWDDSEEVFKGWNMAWEEFVWCLGVVNKPIEEAAKKAAEEAKRLAAEEAAEKEAAELLEEQEGQVETEDQENETAEETTEETSK